MRPLKKEEMMLVLINEKNGFRVKPGMTSKCHSGESRNPSFFRGRNFEIAEGFNLLLLKKTVSYV